MGAQGGSDGKSMGVLIESRTNDTKLNARPQWIKTRRAAGVCVKTARQLGIEQSQRMGWIYKWGGMIIRNVSTVYTSDWL